MKWKLPEDWDRWKRWFAWYPVIIDDKKLGKHLVWFQYIDRLHWDTGRYEYRFSPRSSIAEKQDHGAANRREADSERQRYDKPLG
jgi:hypothetical protein